AGCRSMRYRAQFAATSAVFNGDEAVRAGAVPIAVSQTITTLGFAAGPFGTVGRLGAVGGVACFAALAAILGVQGDAHLASILPRIRVAVVESGAAIDGTFPTLAGRDAVLGGA